MKKPLYSLLILMLFFTQVSWAEQKVSNGNYELHYNTFPSTFLSKEIANAYQITRSKNRGIVSVSVIDKSNQPSSAIEADVQITAKNLLNQNKEIKFFKIVEENQAVYYLGSFAMNDQEDINFSITATPKNSDLKLTTKFSREFFTD